EEADRLNRLVQNLLEMTRLESGALQLRREWHPLEEVVGSALSRLGKELADRRVDTHVPPDLPLVPIDDVLIEQVLVNLLDNAVKYTPASSPIRILATSTDEAVTVEIADHGPGLPRGDEDKVFEKFDLGLPDMDGLEVIRRVREWTAVPVIVLSARGQERDKVTALDAGADDYMSKPFGAGELLARVRVALRHTAGASHEGDDTVFVV